MILIIGGFHQGKRRFAGKLTGLGETDTVNGEFCDPENLFEKKMIYNLHSFVKRLIDRGIDPLAFFKKHINEIRHKVIITDEIGLGIVPIDKGERHWREMTGRVCCFLAEESGEVYRVYAGIPSKIKG
ncbi:bifunctional adenosylcobinamide kinase/adenosylcobinamide-phosphate guanylyltransferase [Anaerotalea alkaliphila]|uniref:Adenosylcobinamide kinase n=1 Tax=Anaerotalea alkaliphila TaxID=2662126 RepID=A0A7X5HXJ7_9FIRM|nr:bifunctional adenosylcobinamide kinase/adenosylcobinamide-phosphate guanylyltransferase [Anaerotalea alkaliphila]NDL68351.1 hypothetical protein [Anaerotalea alkaliphila]